MKIKLGWKEIELNHDYPTYPMKMEFTPGTYGENEWAKGESACVDRHFYVLPNGSEWAIFKIAERTHTGHKKIRYETWHNGRWYNNYFTYSYDDAVNGMENEIAFFGFEKNRTKYAL